MRVQYFLFIALVLLGIHSSPRADTLQVPRVVGYEVAGNINYKSEGKMNSDPVYPIWAVIDSGPVNFYNKNLQYYVVYNTKDNALVYMAPYKTGTQIKPHMYRIYENYYETFNQYMAYNPDLMISAFSGPMINTHPLMVKVLGLGKESLPPYPTFYVPCKVRALDPSTPPKSYLEEILSSARAQEISVVPDSIGEYLELSLSTDSTVRLDFRLKRAETFQLLKVTDAQNDYFVNTNYYIEYPKGFLNQRNWKGLVKAYIEIHLGDILYPPEKCENPYPHAKRKPLASKQHHHLTAWNYSTHSNVLQMPLK